MRYSGSVKELEITGNASIAEAGIGRLFFTDRFSVFDWGSMPGDIEDKGKSLCMTGAFMLEKIQAAGIKTYYLGLVERGLKSFDYLEDPASVMEVRLLRQIRPELTKDGYSYERVREAEKNFKIPLEVIYRNSLPEGSSVFSRIKSGKLDPAGLGISGSPYPGMELDPPVIEVSTKFEPVDRHIGWDEAREITGLSETELERLRQTAVEISRIITGEIGRIGLQNCDGKMEFGLDSERNIVVADVAGTLDESRFSLNGMPVSKELIRRYYRGTQWYERLRDYRSATNSRTMRRSVGKPPLLPENIRDAVSNVYRSFCNSLTGREWFEAPGLAEAVKTAESLL